MTTDQSSEWLPYYLRDHLAGATAGVNLFERVASGHSDSEVRTEVARLRTQVQQDRDTLAGIMVDLGIRQASLTMLTGVVGELLGRLKPNGHLTTRSPGADVLELEALTAAVQGKAGLWETLLAMAERDPRLGTDQLSGLLDRATSQRDTLIELHAHLVRTLPVE